MVESIGGRWDAARRLYRMPAFWSQVFLDTLRSKLSHLVVDPPVTDLAWQEEALERKASAYHVPASQYPTGRIRPRAGRIPHPYQYQGAEFLLEMQRVILADRPGAGKTVQVILAADQLPEAVRVLVVTPKSTLFQWADEIRQWSLYPSVEILGRKDAPSGDRWTVTNYETLATRPLDLVSRLHPTVLVADEATRLKSVPLRRREDGSWKGSKRARAFFEASKHVPYVWLLTATPVRNRPKELWSLLHIVDPKRYGSWWDFVHVFLEWREGFFGVEVGGVRADRAEWLHTELLPRLLRRTEGLVDLPPLTEHVVHVPLDARADRAYRQMEAAFAALAQDGSVLAARNTLEQYTRLRQITHDPSLCGLPGKSAKTEWILEWLEENADEHKAVIFSPFATFLRRFRDILPAKYGAVLITGEEGAEEREEARRRLNGDPACRVLLAVDQAGGEGLNLQGAADVVIFAGKSWTPDTVEQCIGRVWRQGQERHVHVYSLVAPGTVDEDIETVLEEKRHLATRIVDLSDVIQAMRHRREGT